MQRSDLAPLGVSLTVDDTLGLRAASLESDGVASFWVAGGQLRTLAPLGEIVAATSTARVSSAVAAVEVHDAASVADAYRAAPDRVVVGVGGAQGPRPLPRLSSYLDELDELGVPQADRVLAALAPRRLELARDRTAGALALLVTPEYTARAREILGPDAVLVVHHFAVLDDDPAAARAVLRGPLSFLAGLPGYAANLRRMGFSDDDVAGLSDRLVDAVTAWGDADAVAARLREYLDAGADQVVVDEAAFHAGLGSRMIPAAR